MGFRIVNVIMNMVVNVDIMNMVVNVIIMNMVVKHCHAASPYHIAEAIHDGAVDFCGCGTAEIYLCFHALYGNASDCFWQ